MEPYLNSPEDSNSEASSSSSLFDLGGFLGVLLPADERPSFVKILLEL
jgi:hypothetical protein